MRTALRRRRWRGSNSMPRMLPMTSQLEIRVLDLGILGEGNFRADEIWGF